MNNPRYPNPYNGIRFITEYDSNPSLTALCRKMAFEMMLRGLRNGVVSLALWY